jgi:hypothetical protein
VIARAAVDEPEHVLDVPKGTRQNVRTRSRRAAGCSGAPNGTSGAPAATWHQQAGVVVLAAVRELDGSLAAPLQHRMRSCSAG